MKLPIFQSFSAARSLYFIWFSQKIPGIQLLLSFCIRFSTFVFKFIYGSFVTVVNPKRKKAAEKFLDCVPLTTSIMGNKYSTQMKQIQESIQKIDEYVCELADAIDLVHSSADKFASLLQGKDTEHTDSCLSDVNLLHQRLVKMSGMAVHLLMSIAACNETKNNTARQVNVYLHSVKMEVKSICKGDFKGFPTLKLADYPDPQQIHWDDVNENFRKVLSNSLNSLPVKPDLEVKYEQLEKQFLKMQKALDKVILDQTAKELQKSDVKQRPTFTSTKMDIKERSNPVLANIDARQDGKDNEELQKLRNAAECHKQEREDLKKQLKAAEDEKNRKVEDLEKKLEDVRKQLKHAKSENSRFKEEILKKNISETNLQSSFANLEKEKQLLQEEARKAEEKAQSEIESLKESNEKFQQEIFELQKDIDESKRKKYLKVQIYSKQRGDQITDIENELIALLESKMSDKNTEVNFIKCVHSSQIQKDKPLLNLCINASRLGTDASNALSGIKVTPNMALLVLHLKDVHALPSQASNRVLVGQQFKDLGGIFDMAFLSNKGIYDCEMNEVSITQIIGFILKAFEGSQ